MVVELAVHKERPNMSPFEIFLSFSHFSLRGALWRLDDSYQSHVRINGILQKHSVIKIDYFVFLVLSYCYSPILSWVMNVEGSVFSIPCNILLTPHTSLFPTPMVLNVGAMDP